MMEIFGLEPTPVSVLMLVAMVRPAPSTFRTQAKHFSGGFVFSFTSMRLGTLRHGRDTGLCNTTCLYTREAQGYGHLVGAAQKKQLSNLQRALPPPKPNFCCVCFLAMPLQWA
jgi:hypothetical protein